MYPCRQHSADFPFRLNLYRCRIGNKEDSRPYGGKSEKPKPDPVIDSQIVVVDRHSRSAKLATMPQKGRTLLFASLLSAVFAGLALCFTSNRTPPRSSLPNPNGYDDFLTASLALSGDVGNFRTGVTTFVARRYGLAGPDGKCYNKESPIKTNTQLPGDKTMQGNRQRKYKKYLRSLHWKKLRRKVLSRDARECVLCGSADDLQAHHETYREKFRDSIPEDLITLCRACHEEQHGLSTVTSSRQGAIKSRRDRSMETCSISVFRSSLEVGIYYDALEGKWIGRV